MKHAYDENKIFNKFAYLKFKFECPVLSFAKSGTPILEARWEVSSSSRFQALLPEELPWQPEHAFPGLGEHPPLKVATPPHPCTLGSQQARLLRYFESPQLSLAALVLAGLWPLLLG